MYIHISQDEEGTILLKTSDGTTAEKALELCLAAMTMYRADVREEKREMASDGRDGGGDG